MISARLVVDQTVSRRTAQQSSRESKCSSFITHSCSPRAHSCRCPFFLSAFSFWSRCIRDCAPAVQQRFKSHMQMFFQAVHQQAFYRADGIVPDLETYIEMRLEAS